MYNTLYISKQAGEVLPGKRQQIDTLGFGGITAGLHNNSLNVTLTWISKTRSTQRRPKKEGTCGLLHHIITKEK